MEQQVKFEMLQMSSHPILRLYHIFISYDLLRHDHTPELIVSIKRF